MELREELSGGQTIDFHQVQVRKGHLEVLKDEVIEQEKSVKTLKKRWKATRRF